MADFDDVRRRLSAKDVFTGPGHDWKTQRGQWKGSCPWHDSDSGTCFTVDPETLDWHCFSCGRGGGPLEYAAELDGTGADAPFLQKWRALSELTGCEGPGARETGSGTTSGSPRRSRGAHRSGKPAKTRKPAGASVRAAPAPNEIPKRLGTESASTQRPKAGPYTERELRSALVEYRRALPASDRAREYIEGRGLSVDTLYQLGCGYAAPGEWLEDDVQNENGTYVHRAKRGRIVTPHTTPSGQLVNLYGRAVGAGPDWLKHRHLQGPKGLFNAPAIREGGGPLVVCESSLDALSMIEAGAPRAVAVHGKSGLPWKEVRGAVETVVIALDEDAGAETAKLARAATLRGVEAHILPSSAYGGHSDPNAALQAGALDLSYLAELANAGASGAVAGETPAEGAGPEGGHETAADDHTGGRGGASAESPPLTSRATWPVSERTAAYDGRHTPAPPEDLVGYWNGDVIGHLGRWIWTRPEAPSGPAGGGVYADAELHRWIVQELDAGPSGAENAGRLRYVLWRLYAAFGPEDVPEALLPDPPESGAETGAHAGENTAGQSETYSTGRLPDAVQTAPAPAPADSPHSSPRGIEVDTPYSEPFVHDLKTIPEWGRSWDGDTWIVDVIFAEHFGAIAREHFGD